MAKIVKDEKDKELDLTKVKEELECYIDLQLKKSFNEELERTHNKLIRAKNIRLFWKNIIILILLCLIGFLVYLLYTNNYFDKYFHNNKVTINDTIPKNDDKSKDENKEIETKEPSLNDLIKEYSYLLDNIYINENSIYLKDYYSGNLTDELKNYLAFNLVDLNKIDDDLILNSNTLLNASSLIFNEKNNNITFDYNGVKVKYLKSLDSYIIEENINKNKSNIDREIINIEVNNKQVKITTIEGLIKNNKLYNILNNHEIKRNSNEDSLKDYENKLNKVIYIFNNEMLESISK